MIRTDSALHGLFSRLAAPGIAGSNGYGGAVLVSASIES